MKYCPLCEAEYADAYGRCTACGVELAAEERRGRPLNEKERNDKIELAWRGGDPQAVSQVVAILREAGIPHHVQPTNDHMVFELGMPRPKYAVRVFASDLQKARELLADIRETAPFTFEEPGADQEPAETPRKETKWQAESANVEVWHGEDSAQAQILQDSLRENRIGVKRAGEEPGLLRLLVMPADEAPSREIVREVLEGTPLA
jgi:hypothetical protein